MWPKKNLSQVQSEQYHHQSLCNRVKYLKLSEVKIRSCHGTVVECRTRHPETLGSNPGVAKKNLSQVQSEQYHHQSLCTRVKYLKLSEVKIRSCHGTVVECRTRHPETLSPALYHCAMATSDFHLWQFQVFNSGAEGLVVVLFWLDLWEIFFLATPGFEPGVSGCLVLHSTTVPRQLLIFISDNFRYLTLVQRDWWWYCSDWTCERFSFWPHQGLSLGTLDL